jgi:hypothetical protein
MVSVDNVSQWNDTIFLLSLVTNLFSICYDAKVVKYHPVFLNIVLYAQVCHQDMWDRDLYEYYD